MFRLIEDELRRNPDSCFSVNLKSWYNSLYSELLEPLGCSYQVEVNNDLCSDDPPETVQEVVDIILAFVAGNTRELARQLIRLICRLAIRQDGLSRAPE